MARQEESSGEWQRRRPASDREALIKNNRIEAGRGKEAMGKSLCMALFDDSCSVSGIASGIYSGTGSSSTHTTINSLTRRT